MTKLKNIGWLVSERVLKHASYVLKPVLHHHLGNNVQIQDCLCHEPLDASKAGFLRRPVVKGRGELREVHRIQR